jgi:hypothetical protein
MTEARMSEEVGTPTRTFVPIGRPLQRVMLRGGAEEVTVIADDINLGGADGGRGRRHWVGGGLA